MLLLVQGPPLEYLYSRTAYRHTSALLENEGTKNLPGKALVPNKLRGLQIFTEQMTNE